MKNVAAFLLKKVSLLADLLVLKKLLHIDLFRKILAFDIAF